MGISSIEVVYRGVLQMLLGRKICRGTVLAARRGNKTGFTFGRYGDSPERIGIPAKHFAVIGDSIEELQPFMTPYELANNDVTVVVDDTICKGVESWGWHGLQPINRLTKPGGTLLVLSQMSPEDLLRVIPTKGTEYNLAVIKGSPVWSSMWRFEDDTDARILGAIAKIAPHIIGLDSAEQVITEEWEQKDKTGLARQAYGEVQVRKVSADEGIKQPVPETKLPPWQKMAEALVVPAVPSGKVVKEGPYQAERNPHYKSLSTRTNRPVMDFSRCRKCHLCWLHCPEGVLDITPDGFYNIDFEYCNGCGICASICPVEDCIVMVSEQRFADNESQWETWQKDNKTYADWVKDMKSRVPSR